MVIENNYIPMLKEAVSKKYGKKIDSLPDCITLAEEVANVGFQVNPQTYRRFFGLVRYHGGFSTYTLDSLAAFCGYNSIHEFNERQDNDATNRQIFDPSTYANPETYWQLSEDLCRKILDSPEVLSQIHHELLHYPLARTYFMEHHPMRDLICTVYSQYFQEYLKYSQSNESRIFAYGFLFVGAYLSANKDFMSIYHQKVAETPLTPEVHVIPSGRKFGVPLLYAFQKGDNKTFDKVFKNVVEIRENYILASQKSVCSFEASVLEHLIFTDRVDEMKFLIDNNTEQCYKDRKFIPLERKENHEETWKIMCAVAYQKMGEETACFKLLEKVDLSKLSLGWKKYYSILYYFTRYHFAPAPERIMIKNKLRMLINETHFMYYREQFQQLK